MQDVGYILGNIKRKQVLEIFERRENLNKEAVASLVRLPPVLAERMVDELVRKGFLERKGDSYSLTSRGRSILKKVTKIGSP
jgi:predicted transcriptional regulator